MYGDQFNLSFFSIAKSLCNVTDSSPAVGAPSPFSSDSLMSTASTLDAYELVGNEFFSAYGIMSMLNSEMVNYCSSDPPSYASQTSPGRYESPQPSLMSSIQNNCFDRRSLPSFCGLVQSERICGDGDAQMMKRDRSKSQWLKESESRMIIKGMGKACRYSVEEKKERIERYRSKRNQRNFSKKIKYECRKTLADSRIRVKGRFARNEEIEKNSSEQWSPAAIGDDENDVGYDHNWINFPNNIPSPRIPFHNN